jgi:Homing endonuclease associated repeat
VPGDFTVTRPSYRNILGRFGSWNAAIKAAGFDPRRRGDYDRDTPAGKRPGRSTADSVRSERHRDLAADLERVGMPGAPSALLVGRHWDQAPAGLAAMNP